MLIVVIYITSFNALCLVEEHVLLHFAHQGSGGSTCTKLEFKKSWKTKCNIGMNLCCSQPPCM